MENVDGEQELPLTIFFIQIFLFFKNSDCQTWPFLFLAFG